MSRRARPEIWRDLTADAVIDEDETHDGFDRLYRHPTSTAGLPSTPSDLQGLFSRLVPAKRRRRSK